MKGMMKKKRRRKMAEGDFDWKIWFSKLGKGVGLVLLVTFLLYVADYLIANPLPADYAFWAGLVIIALQQIANFIKHKYGLQI